MLGLSNGFKWIEIWILYFQNFKNIFSLVTFSTLLISEEVRYSKNYQLSKENILFVITLLFWYLEEAKQWFELNVTLSWLYHRHISFLKFLLASITMEKFTIKWYPKFFKTLMIFIRDLRFLEKLYIIILPQIL